MPLNSDIDLSPDDIAKVASVDALAAFLTRLGYPTGGRKELSATALGLTGETAEAIRSIELLAEDAEGFLRVVFVKLRSVTAKARNDLARNLGKRNVDHLLVLASDFEAVEFVLIDKRTRQQNAPGGGTRVQIIPRTVSVVRKASTQLDRRILRRLTWTGKDGLDQFDKLRSVFEAAAYTGEYFQNRALFADHYLETRLREDEAWQENPSAAFRATKDVMRGARTRWTSKAEQVVRDELYEPLWSLLGYAAKVNKPAEKDHLEPDYVLHGAHGDKLTVAFVYRWDRWLDGPDLSDPDTPDENPGAAVVSALARGDARWVIVTNGKLWRLYSREAHSRSTNFYEVDLEEALLASGETDPNEAFRYWWLFFRQQAFAPCGTGTHAGEPVTGTMPAPQTCWLDTVFQGSRDYAKRLGERLKDRIFVEIFPHLAQGFLADRKKRLGITKQPAEEELRDTFEATLTLLYRLLFLLYAESRDLLPIREGPYHDASLKRIKAEIADKASTAEGQVAEKLQKAYADTDTKLYDRLSRLFSVMDKGDSLLNVPCYNGGLFLTEATKRRGGEATEGDGPETSSREHRIARFLVEHKVPDRHLALAIDRLARDQDEKTLGLVFIDYKSLEVRHLGSIYEGLLEFRLKVADEDLATVTEKKREKYIPLSEVKAGRSKKAAAAVVRKGEVYLSNDKAERKATGSYYTPDPIVEYIVEHTVGPVLAERLETLRDEFNKAGKTFHRHLANARDNPALLPKGADAREFAAAKTYAEHKDLVEKVFDFKVLDPAMGSGHFLVEAVDFLTDHMLDFLNRFPNNPVSYALDKTRTSILEALTQQSVVIDPDKLTDINLLKRHILKRCIYGVDLNPMAVELAKVSLWLDAFTLGAPLSFLDHHLRCGNSLIGSTFEDLRKVTEGQLFAIDYEPLLRAIRDVLFVNAMADATAAEVHQSADKYAHARNELSGFQIVFDLLTAEYFTEGLELAKRNRGALKAQVSRPAQLLEHADALDLSSLDAFVTSLSDDSERRLVAQVRSLARRPDRRFFHWEIEFPEIYFAFADADQRRIEHKDDIAAGSAGFDTIVGNPPYVRQESIKELKGFLKGHYTTFESTNDLYVYFQEQEVRNLKAGGRMGMIVANKWMRAGYGERLRGFLQRTAQPLEVIDFGHSPIFPDADTFPCIPIVARRAAPITKPDQVPDGEAVLVCSVPREHWHERMNLGEFVTARRTAVPTRLLRDEGWSLEDPRVQSLLEKIRKTGVPLKEYCGSGTCRGPGTGFNDAFYIDALTRTKLIAEHGTAAELIHPLLRGRDMRRWCTCASERYAIVPFRGVAIGAYPSIRRHLEQYRERLSPKPKNREDGATQWPGRRAGEYEWYELQDNPGQDVVGRMTQPKTVWQEMGWFSRFGVDKAGSFLGNTAYYLLDTGPLLRAVLNSRLGWWFMWRTAQHGKDEVLRFIGDYIDEFPLPSIPSPMTEEIASSVEAITQETLRYQEFENAVAEQFRNYTADAQAGPLIAGYLALPADTFGHRIAKLAEAKRLPDATLETLSHAQTQLRTRQVELCSRQLEMEKHLAALVENAYGLTPEDRQLLRATRPVRDPIDVLKAKIVGQFSDEESTPVED